MITLSTCLSISHVLNHTNYLNNMVIEISKGKFYYNSHTLDLNVPHPYSIRFSRNFEKLCGELGVNSHLIPGFGAVGLALS